MALYRSSIGVFCCILIQSSQCKNLLTSNENGNDNKIDFENRSVTSVVENSACYFICFLPLVCTWIGLCQGSQTGSSVKEHGGGSGSGGGGIVISGSIGGSGGGIISWAENGTCDIICKIPFVCSWTPVCKGWSEGSNEGCKNNNDKNNNNGFNVGIIGRIKNHISYFTCKLPIIGGLLHNCEGSTSSGTDCGGDIDNNGIDKGGIVPGKDSSNDIGNDDNGGDGSTGSENNGKGGSGKNNNNESKSKENEGDTDSGIDPNNDNSETAGGDGGTGIGNPGEGNSNESGIDNNSGNVGGAGSNGSEGSSNDHNGDKDVDGDTGNNEGDKGTGAGNGNESSDDSTENADGAGSNGSKGGSNENSGVDKSDSSENKGSSEGDKGTGPGNNEDDSSNVVMYGTFPSGKIVIKSNQTNDCFSIDEKKKVVFEKCTNSPKQIWQVIPGAREEYERIKSVDSGDVWDVQKGCGLNRNVIVYKPNGNTNQDWKLVDGRIISSCGDNYEIEIVNGHNVKVRDGSESNVDTLNNFYGVPTM